MQFQLSVVDILANHTEILNKYYTLFYQHSNMVKRIVVMEDKANESKKELDYLQFQFEQLDSAKLIENEQEVSLNAEQVRKLTKAFDISGYLTFDDYYHRALIWKRLVRLPFGDGQPTI